MTRIEKDSLGEVSIPENKLWGSQTQRSLMFFNIGSETLPWGLISALIKIKKAASVVNAELDLIDSNIAILIQKACDQLLEEKSLEHFPVRIWQTGSGTQSNMNVNEVIANLANTYAGNKPGTKKPVHPNDHVNRAQSSNDVFPSAMHIFAKQLIDQQLIPVTGKMLIQLTALEEQWTSTFICGRTHMMDALPLTLAQIVSGYRYQFEQAESALRTASEDLNNIALGGTAVGTGANAPENFGERVCEQLNQLYDMSLQSHANKFAALSSQDEINRCAQAVNLIAVVLQKMADDIRLLASGPNSAIGELKLPENEPGSSIMPGKVNPTQCEALTMICIQVTTNCQAILLAISQGQLQLNTYRPLIIRNFAESVTLLAEGMNSFTQHCLCGLTVDNARVQEHLDKNLMLITVATPLIGYDNASKIARHALLEKTDIYTAAEALKIISAEELHRYIAEKLRHR